MEKGDPMEEGYSQLSDAIMQAISHSPEIRQILAGLREKNLITQESYFNFILSLEELSTLLEMPPTAPEGNRLEKIPSPANGGKGNHDLTDNEVKFEEYYRKVFDEKEWLRKARLKF